MSETFAQGYALLVGIGGDLPNTVNDAVGIADVLKDPMRCSYPSDHVQLLIGEVATRIAILSALDQLAQSTDSQSVVVIYFSGHGYRVTSPMGKSYYLLPSGYNMNQLYETAVSGTEFTDKLRVIPAQKLLVLLDCCHAGGVGATTVTGLELVKSPLPPEAMDFFLKGAGRVLIASSREGELSFAGKPYSAFTLVLIETLCGIGLARMDGYVRVSDLAMHASEVVPRRTADRQHPILHFEHADNFVLAYYAGGGTEPKGLPFSSEPEIEPEPGAWTISGQSYQTVRGSQANISGDVQGLTQVGDINMQVGFFQPCWTILGGVMQAQRDIVVSRDFRHESDALTQVFADLVERVRLLPADDQVVVKPLVEQVHSQTQKIQTGDASHDVQSGLERRLKNLVAMAPDIGEVAVATLADPSAGIAMLVRKIAQKVQNELKSSAK